MHVSLTDAAEVERQLRGQCAQSHAGEQRGPVLVRRLVVLRTGGERQTCQRRNATVPTREQQSAPTGGETQTRQRRNATVRTQEQESAPTGGEGQRRQRRNATARTAGSADRPRTVGFDTPRSEAEHGALVTGHGQ